MNEELKEYIIAKRTPISSCVGLSKYFIGRHRTSPVYLTPEFEREFNNKMCELEKLKEQLERSENARKESMLILGEYKHYTLPTEEQNRENEDIVDKAYNNLILKQDIDKGE